MATASALATVLAFVGFTAVLFIALSATLNQAPPRVIPHSDILGPNMKLQDRLQGYFQHLFLGSDEIFGQIQRFGALAFFAGGLLAELWFLGTLSRLAAWLHNARALGRVNRFAIAAGFIILLLVLGGLAYDLFGQDAFSKEVRPKWDGLPAGSKNTIRAAVTAGLVVILAFIYARSLSGLRSAIREAAPA